MFTSSFARTVVHHSRVMTSESVVHTEQAAPDRLGLPIDPRFLGFQPGHAQNEVIPLIHFEHSKVLGEIEIAKLDGEIDIDLVSRDNQTRR